MFSQRHLYRTPALPSYSCDKHHAFCATFLAYQYTLVSLLSWNSQRPNYLRPSQHQAPLTHSLLITMTSRCLFKLGVVCKLLLDYRFCSYTTSKKCCWILSPARFFSRTRSIVPPYTCFAVYHCACSYHRMIHRMGTHYWFWAKWVQTPFSTLKVLPVYLQCTRRGNQSSSDVGLAIMK